MLLALFMSHAGEENRMAIAGHALLMGMSAQTTTGFSSMPVTALDNASKLVLIASMAVGGSVGSTAGGIKLLRLLLLLRMLQLVIRRAAMPRHAVVELHFGGRVVENAELVRALLPVTLFVAVMLVSWLPFLALGYEPLNALFEVVSAIGTVGLSSGITAPDLPLLLKGVLSADMLLGRLEFVAVLILLYPATWIGKRSVSS
jgi:trk system potassium uptake protein TrkH